MPPVNLPKAARLALGERLDVAVELGAPGTREARFPLGLVESRLRKSTDGLQLRLLAYPWLPRRNRATNYEGLGFTGTDSSAVEHESARRFNNRLSAPVSARSLLPKFSFVFSSDCISNRAENSLFKAGRDIGP